MPSVNFKNNSESRAALLLEIAEEDEGTSHRYAAWTADRGITKPSQLSDTIWPKPEETLADVAQFHLDRMPQSLIYDDKAPTMAEINDILKAIQWH